MKIKLENLLKSFQIWIIFNCSLVSAIHYNARSFLSLNLSSMDNYNINNIDIPEDAILTTPEIIRKYGYPVETYENILTEDGYYLTFHRIPYGKISGPAENKPIVYIQPGFIANSADAVIAGPDSAIGYYFADAGYDVWIGNTRGSRYCTKHKFTSKWSRKYWDFSWSDIGYYDTPAMVDFILNVTKQENLFYIGHSRGTTVFFVMAATRPEYNKKIRAMAAMAPVTYMNHVPNPIFHIAAHNAPFIKSLANALNIYQITVNNTQLIQLCKSLENINIIQPNICELVAFSLAGFDYDNFNTSILSTFIGHVPDSFAIKEFEHFGQTLLSGKFCNFDYGPSMNLIKYNQREPPEYDLSQVSAPVVLLYSGNDLQSSVVDVDRLSLKLRNLAAKYLLPEGPCHYSYFNGKYARTQVYDKIMNVFQNY